MNERISLPCLHGLSPNPRRLSLRVGMLALLCCLAAPVSGYAQETTEPGLPEDITEPGYAEEIAEPDYTDESTGNIEAPEVDLTPAPDRARITIDDSTPGAGFEKITLTTGKAAVVELPREARDILVANPAIADARVRTARQIYIIGGAVGTTSALFFDEAGEQILNLEINVALDLSAVTAALRTHLPDNELRAEALGANLTLSGRVPNLAASNRAISIARRFVSADENIVNLLTIEGDEQVMLRVRIAEMRRNVTKQLGINLAGDIRFGGGSSFGVSTDNKFNIAGGLAGGLTAGGLTDSDGIKVGGNLNGLLEALERDGLVRLLAEPNLTAVSGESARFLAGGEFPVTTGRDENGIATVEFKPFGVGLGFTPVVLSDGRISLRMSTEVSELTGTFGELDIPGLSVRRAETTVELPSGGSLVIGGLLQNDIRRSVDGIPGLKDIPVLGALFRSNDFQNNETELVIVVTPYLVSPAREEALLLPSDGFAPAGDFDSYLLGRISGVYKRRAGAETSLQGPYGFIME